MQIKLFISDKMPYKVSTVKFLQRMLNRLAFGYFRYEVEYKLVTPNFIKRARKAIDRYESTRNKEALIDAANYCLKEFEIPSIDGTYFSSEDSNGKRRKDD